MVDIRAHHQRAIEQVVERFRNDPAFEAVIIGGSVAHGLARDDSDIDIMLVATPEEYARRAASRDLFVLEREIFEYAGGYLDAKIIDRAFLEDVALRGSEPARWAFADAIIGSARIPDLPELLARITAYPEHTRAGNLRSFYAQLCIHGWFLQEAEKREDLYLATRATAQMVLFGGRLILAYNRILFPFHKHFMAELRRAPEKPNGIMALAETLLQSRTPEAGAAFRDAITEWQDWGVTWRESAVQFLLDTEWTWREGWTPVDDR